MHAIVKGDYKLIYSTRDKWTELYNLQTDESEKNNLYLLMPEKVKELNDDLLEWEKTLPAKPMWPRIMDHRFMIDGKEYFGDDVDADNTKLSFTFKNKAEEKSTA